MEAAAGRSTMDADGPWDQQRGTGGAAGPAFPQQQQQQQQQPLQPQQPQQQQLHVCDHRCSVERLVGIVYRCKNSGQVHICDNNCSQRVHNDRYSAVCRVSRRVFVCYDDPAPCRKRAVSTTSGDAQADASACKRGPGAGGALGGAGGYLVPPAGSQGDAMVM